MVTILLRTFIIYTILVAAMRLMGKRQIGELEISDLVTTLLISEIASLPIENRNIPISFAIIPIITIVTVEVATSVILMKFPNLKTIISTRPSTLIKNGKIDQKELKKVRISAEELIGELRQQGAETMDEINYAILEQNGKITVIKKAGYSPVTNNDINIRVKEHGIMHILISNGYVNKYNLKLLGKDHRWLLKKLSDEKCNLSDIFLYMIDDSGKSFCIRKDRK